MKLKTENFKEACTVIKNAIDSKNVSLYNETLELVADGNILSMNVTNREYYVTVEFDLEEEAQLKAAVNAQLFLSLISKITSESIELTIENNSIKIKGNGDYKLPLIYNGATMLELPKININNVTNTMTINSSILQSILQFNSKELQRGDPARLVQEYYYVDDHGCITFTSGACVNNFVLEKPIKILLSEKVVRLFKLFKNVTTVSFTIGQDPLEDSGITQTKVKFESGNVTLTAILQDDNLISSVPVDAIRGMSTKEYPYAATVNRLELVQILDRLMLFNNDKNYGKLEFKNGSIVIKDWSSENTEVISVANDCPALSSYSTIVNMNNLKLVLDGCEDDFVTICFGDSRALVFKKQLVSDILPELSER